MTENRECPYCNGTAINTGTLGQTEHYRCQNCGIQFSVSPKPKAKNKKAQKKLAKDLRAARRAKQAFQQAGE